MIKNVGIMTIGDEVLQGRILDKNKANVGQFFVGRGANIVLQVSPPDDGKAIEAALLFALEQVDLLVITGGLGQTKDDMTYAVTRNALPDYEVEEIPNHVGAASGYLLKNHEKSLILLPGPPRENLPMLLSLEASFEEEALYEAFYHLSGIGEYALEQQFDHLFGEDARHLVTYVSLGFVTIKLSTRDQEKFERLHALLEETFQDYIFHRGELQLEEKIFALLKEKNLTLSCVESATAGSVLHSLTKLSGSSEVIYGGLVVYQEDAKVDLTQLSREFLAEHSTVSRETSMALAEQGNRIMGTDITLALTGYAEHDEEAYQGQCYVAIQTPAGMDHYYHKVGSWRRASSRNAMRVFALSCLLKSLAQL